MPYIHTFFQQPCRRPGIDRLLERVSPLTVQRHAQPTASLAADAIEKREKELIRREKLLLEKEIFLAEKEKRLILREKLVAEKEKLHQ